MSVTQGKPNDHHSHAPPPPAEPKTPMWLPALGAVLFLTFGLLWGLMPSSDDAKPSGAGGNAAPAADAGAVRHP